MHRREHRTTPVPHSIKLFDSERKDFVSIPRWNRISMQMERRTVLQHKGSDSVHPVANRIELSSGSDESLQNRKPP
jgi:hypothetical protein